MEEREICCCGAKGWALVIGWLQIIVNILVFRNLILVFPDEPERLPAIFVVIIVIRMIFAILSIIMACVLIRGCKSKNPKQLNYWIIFAKISLVIFVLTTLAELFGPLAAQALWRMPMSTIIVRCIEAAIQVFFIWVVGIHKWEMEASSGVEVAYKA